MDNLLIDTYEVQGYQEQVLSCSFEHVATASQGDGSEKKLAATWQLSDHKPVLTLGDCWPNSSLNFNMSAYRNHPSSSSTLKSLYVLAHLCLQYILHICLSSWYPSLINL